MHDHRCAVIRRVLLAALLVTAGLAALPSPAHGFEGPDRCGRNYDCVGPVTVTPSGASARFQLETSVRAEVKVVASTTPDLKGPGSFGGNLTPSKTHDFGLLAVLQPGTLYHYRLTAIDGMGRRWREYGTFTTLQRKFTVRFSKIHVIKDSDSTGAGELTFHLRAHDTVLYRVYDNESVDTGDNLFPDRTIHVVGAPQAIWVMTQGEDDDCDVGEFCTAGLDPNWDSGWSSESDWATARDVLEAPGGGVETGGSFSMETTDTRLKFRVEGTWSVTYVP